jgi:hypothetical protein
VTLEAELRLAAERARKAGPLPASWERYLTAEFAITADSLRPASLARTAGDAARRLDTPAPERKEQL